VVVDRNGNEQVDAGVDAPAPDLQVALLSGGDTVTTATTDANGVFRFPGLPVGTYRVTVRPSALGDSLRLTGVDSAHVTVAAADTPVVTVRLGYPIATAKSIQSLPAGKLVTLTGVALNASNVYGDSTLYLADATGTARVAKLPPSVRVATGDSVRVLGRTGRWHERPAVVEPAVSSLGTGRVPAPVAVSTGDAVGAKAGTLDGALVRITDARVLDVSKTSGGDTRLSVTDGSGTLRVVLDRDARITSEDPLVNGVKLDATGLLVPDEAGTEWQLKPRTSQDLTARVPRMTAEEIRSQPTGTVVILEGVALNGLSDFGDNSLHVADPTGALRALGLAPTFLFAGDSVSVLGVVGISNGQVVLTRDSATVIGKASAPVPREVSTEAAASANDGALDAALVKVVAVTVDSVRNVLGGDVWLVVDDDSGNLTVVLDKDTGIGLSRYHVGDSLDVTGVLVPAGTSWMLKPRAPADVVKR
jgi:hypothetical protein